MKSIEPKDISPQLLQSYLQGAVAPRPIALASTVDENGNPNLSPFSFFNVFSSNPPILIFSPARRVRNNTTKHTLENVIATKEVVINIVNYEMVHQISLSSTEYPDGVNEFVKAGFTAVASDLVKPFRVAESPVQFECKVNDIISLGTEGGAGNLVICEVIKIHIDENILDENQAIDQHKIDLISRLGGNWYSRSNQGLFEIPKPLTTLGVGVDAIPDYIRQSPMFTGNELGFLGNIEKIPTQAEVTIFINSNKEVERTLNTYIDSIIFEKVKQFIAESDIESAWKLLLAAR